ncbi:ABC transporter ATP-binding protein [bacterium]|nr:ABC transporter ATP-binding protein [candidate division CSSED10-310 bacterium]
MSTDPVSIITLKNVSFSYDDTRLIHRVNLMVAPGDMIGIVGPNGSGKSTLLRLINGLLVPREGTVWLGSRPMQKVSTRSIARQIAFVPQQTVVAHGFSALEIVLMGRFPYKSMVAFENEEDLAIARRMMELTGTLPFSRRRFDSLSGGEQQRVILASALAQEPRVLVLDEPTSALDIFYQIDIFNILKRFNRDNRMTIICAVHDINLAARYCRRIWLMAKDRDIRDGEPGQVLNAETITSLFRVRMRAIATGHGWNWLIPDPAEEPV